MFDSFEWSLATVLGPLLLAAAIAYALITRRRLSGREQARRDEGTRTQYRDETGEPSRHPANQPGTPGADRRP